MKSKKWLWQCGGERCIQSTYVVPFLLQQQINWLCEKQPNIPWRNTLIPEVEGMNSLSQLMPIPEFLCQEIIMSITALYQCPQQVTDVILLSFSVCVMPHYFKNKSISIYQIPELSLPSWALGMGVFCCLHHSWVAECSEISIKVSFQNEPKSIKYSKCVHFLRKSIKSS